MMAKAYVCDICGATVACPHSARMREFCFTVSNCDIYQVPQKDKVKTKIDLCNNCFEWFKAVAKEKARKKKGGSE